MRTRLALLAVALADAAAGASVIETRKFPSEALGREIECRVFLPDGHNPRGPVPLPVIYLLHGRGGNLDAWTTVRPDLDRMIAEKRVPPLIAVMPDGPSGRRAGYYVDSEFAGAGELPAGERVETAFTRDLVAGVDRAFHTRTDRGGRIVGGFSMGGYGALRFALAHPEIFGAAIVLSPAVYVPLPPMASSTREFGAFGRGGKVFDDAVYAAKNYPALIAPFEARGLPVAMFIGVGDDEQALPGAADAVHDLDYEAHTLYNRVRRARGIDAELRVVDGGHDWRAWRPLFCEGLESVLRRLASPAPSPRGKP